MNRDKPQTSVFDRSSIGGRVAAERLDQPGEEHFSPEIAEARRVAATASAKEVHHAGLHIPEGRNDDSLVRDTPDNGNSYYWNPTPPPRSDATAIRWAT